MITAPIRYGALSAKARAMRARHLSAEDFMLLSSMSSVPQIIEFLRRQPAWAGSLSFLKRVGQPRASFEALLHTAVFDDYMRLARFVPKKDRLLYKTWLLLVEIEMALSFLELLSGGRPEEFRLTLPAPLLSAVSFEAPLLLEARSYDDFLFSFARSPIWPVLKQFAPGPDRPFDYTAIDLALSAFYFRTVIDKTRASYKGAALKKQLDALGEQCDLVNLTRVLRLHRYLSAEPGALVPYLLPFYHHLKEPFFYRLLKAKSEDEAYAQIAQTRYGPFFTRHDYAYAEQHLHEFRFSFFQRAFHTAAPSLLTAFAYLELKQTEVRNLIHIIECVHYQIPKADIPAYLTGIDRLSYDFIV